MGYSFSITMYTAHVENLKQLNERIPVLERSIVKAKQKVKDLERYFNDIEEAKKKY